VSHRNAPGAMSAIALIVKPVSPSVGFISVFGADDGDGVGISFYSILIYSFHFLIDSFVVVLESVCL
jgi:hypothetical protein